MAKLNLNALPLPKRRVETKTFSDKEVPGAEITFTLRRLLVSEQTAAFDAAAAWWEFNEGNEFALGENQTFFVGDGGNNPPEGQVFGTLSFIRQVFLIQAMQTGDPEGVYSELDIIRFLVKMPNAASSLVTWVGQIQGTQKTDAEGNL